MNKTTSEPEMICNTDGDICFERNDFRRMIREAEPRRIGRANITLVRFIESVFHKYVVTFSIAVLLAFALFMYGNEPWMIARFMAFSVVCMLLVNITALIAPLSLAFSTNIYNYMLTIAGLEPNILTMSVFILSMLIGTLGFIVMLYQIGVGSGFLAGKWYRRRARE
jgi:hypothetical protein